MREIIVNYEVGETITVPDEATDKEIMDIAREIAESRYAELSWVHDLTKGETIYS